MSSGGVLPSRLEKMCMDLLQNTLCFPTNPEQLQVLCTAILREMSPFDDLALSCDHTQNTRQLSLVASVLLAQVTQLPPLGVGGGVASVSCGSGITGIQQTGLSLSVSSAAKTHSVRSPSPWMV